MPLTKSPHDPETGNNLNMANTYINDKSQPQAPKVDGNHAHRNPSSWSTMPSIRYTLILLLLLVSAAVTYVAGAPSHHDLRGEHSDPSEQSSFAALLSSVSDASLHDVLHKCVSGKYKHGTYPEDRTAMSAVQKENAPLATSIVELAKRQSNSTGVGGTSVTVSTVTSTPLTTITTTSTSSSIISSSSGSGSTSGGSSTSSSVSTTSSVVVTSSAVSTSALVSTITQSGSTFVTTTGSITISSATTVTNVEKTTSVGGSGSKTTEGPKSSFTSVFLVTTTLPNGSRSTITSTSVVVGVAGVAATATGPTGTPPLQNAGGKNSINVVGLLVSAIAIALTI